MDLHRNKNVHVWLTTIMHTVRQTTHKYFSASWIWTCKIHTRFVAAQIKEHIFCTMCWWLINKVLDKRGCKSYIKRIKRKVHNIHILGGTTILWSNIIIGLYEKSMWSINSGICYEITQKSTACTSKTTTTFTISIRKTKLWCYNTIRRRPRYVRKYHRTRGNKNSTNHGVYDNKMLSALG